MAFGNDLCGGLDEKVSALGFAVPADKPQGEWPIGGARCRRWFGDASFDRAVRRSSNFSPPQHAVMLFQVGGVA
jgi:hypothetical protein